MRNKDRIVFWGTPDISKNILEFLLTKYNIVGVVTQPDRPYGRKRILTPTPVKRYAIEKNISLLTPSVFDNDFVEKLKEMNADIFIVVAYGRIIPLSILKIANIVPLNIHYSLLPEFRGPSPITYVLWQNKKKTGISIIEMNDRMDAGDILYQRSMSIDIEDDYDSLERKLTELAKSSIEEVMDNLKKYIKKKVAQDDKKATYTELLNRDCSLVNWFDTSQNIYSKIRAFSDWPQAYSFLNGREIKILESEIVKCENGFPGEVTDVRKRYFIVRTIDGGLMIKKVKPCGKNMRSASDFISGRGVKKGDRFQLIMENELPNLNSIKKETVNNFSIITIHHTNSYNYSNRSDETIYEAIKKYHIGNRKWNDIGYHFVIGRQGELFKGRYPEKIGAHCMGSNEGNLGIALIGDFNIKLPSVKQLATLIYLIQYIKRIKSMKVYGHRELTKNGFTTCPGDHLYGILGYFNA